MSTIRSLVALGVVGCAAGVAFLYSGWYPMGADTPHTKMTFWALETLREQSVARASAELEVPPLSGAKQLLAGGADYNDMCASCHLKPGTLQSDLSIGLYPKPPNFSQPEGDKNASADEDSSEQARHYFWVIKHGIKASGMPAWGLTHDDDRIWSMVAFLQKLPDLSPEQYQIITARKDDSAHH